MPSISSISIVIKAITSPFIKGVRGAIGVVGRFGNVLASLSGIILKLATVGFAVLSASLVGLTLKVIKAASTFETLQTQFITLLGGATAARKRFQELKKFAAETPFQLEDIAKASRILQSLTGGLLATGDGLRLVGDAAAIANEPFAQLAIHIGRLFQGLTTGRAVGESLARLQELGLLSGEARTKIEDLQKAGEKGAKVWNIVKEALESNKGAMKILSETAAGLFSTVKDNLNIALAELGFLLLPIVKVLLKEAIERFQTLQKWVLKNKDAIQKFLVSGLEKILPILIQIGRVGKAIQEVLFQAFGVTGPKSIDLMLDKLETFLIAFEFIIKNFPEAWKLTWQLITDTAKEAFVTILALTISPVKTIIKVWLEGFKFMFKAIIDNAGLVAIALGLVMARSLVFDQASLDQIDSDLKEIGNKIKLNIGRAISEVDFTGIFQTFKEEITKNKATIRDLFGIEETDLVSLGAKIVGFSAKMAQFIEARKAQNKELTDATIAEINSMIEKAKEGGEIIKQTVKAVEGAKQAIKKIGEPTLAIKGSQAAARGELGLVGQGQQMLKLAKQQLKELADINKNIKEQAQLQDANFGFGGA